MAKKKSGGTSIGLILTLIFFVLATFIAGTLAYYGYSEQEQFKTAAKKADDDKKVVEDKYRVERVQKIIERMSIGVEDPADRVLLVSELDALRPQIKEEYDRVLRGIDDKIPDKNAFTWKLLALTSAEVKAKTEGKTADDISSDPDVSPTRTLPSFIQVYKDDAAKARKEKQQVAAELAAAKAQAEEKTTDTAKLKAEFEKSEYATRLAAIKKEQDDRLAKLDADHQALVAKHAKDGDVWKDQIAKQGGQIVTMTDDLAKQKDRERELLAKLDKFENASGGGGAKLAASGGVDFVNMEERKGALLSRDADGFVTINVGRAKKLKPQVNFLVVDANVSWLALLEKEESLKKNSPRLDRQPFEDNPLVKGGIEVVEVRDAGSSRAKITFENEPIRNPIRARDQIFNISWQPEEEMRVAFAGIIDLDGDGLDNNEDFLRMLERQGVIVDEYLRMKPLEFVKRDGKGMTLRTKYLIVAPDPRLDSLPTDKDTPQTLQIKATIEKMSEIKARARELGVQMIEARKFLAMMGIKLPKNPAPPAYGAGTYIDQFGGGTPDPKEPKEPKEPKDAKKDGM
jgi:hypothetical protein